MTPASVDRSPHDDVPPANAEKRRPRTAVLWTMFAGGVFGLATVLSFSALHSSKSADEARTVLRPSSTVLMAVRDLARLETNELHMEKVIDLTDRQSRFFGLVATTDAILLIAAGDVTVGVDLSRLTEHDLEIDRATSQVRLTLPAPEVLSVRLDEARTHVYRRSTGLLAERNEQLESQARTEAVRAIGEAAREVDVMDKARKRAERQLQLLFETFGITHTTIGWRPA